MYILDEVAFDVAGKIHARLASGRRTAVSVLDDAIAGKAAGKMLPGMYFAAQDVIRNALPGGWESQFARLSFEGLRAVANGRQLRATRIRDALALRALPVVEVELAAFAATSPEFKLKLRNTITSMMAVEQQVADLDGELKNGGDFEEALYLNQLYAEYGAIIDTMYRDLVPDPYDGLDL